MTFRDATDELRKEGLSLRWVADAFGVTPNTVSRWRAAHADPENRNALTPPVDWKRTLASRLRAFGARTFSLADQLEAD